MDKSFLGIFKKGPHVTLGPYGPYWDLDLGPYGPLGPRDLDLGPYVPQGPGPWALWALGTWTLGLMGPRDLDLGPYGTLWDPIC